MLGLSALSVLPDVDFVAFMVGIPYPHPFGHRGMTHSLLFATIIGLVVALGLRLRRQPVLLTEAVLFLPAWVYAFWPRSPAPVRG